MVAVAFAGWIVKGSSEWGRWVTGFVGGAKEATNLASKELRMADAMYMFMSPGSIDPHAYLLAKKEVSGSAFYMYALVTHPFCCLLSSPPTHCAHST